MTPEPSASLEQLLEAVPYSVILERKRVLVKDRYQWAWLCELHLPDRCRAQGPTAFAAVKATLAEKTTHLPADPAAEDSSKGLISELEADIDRLQAHHIQMQQTIQGAITEFKSLATEGFACKAGPLEKSQDYINALELLEGIACC